MSLANRAAQFAPFAALTGHNDAIAETARLTDTQREITTDEMNELSRKFAYALSFDEPPVIKITYFHPDGLKAGGSYITITGAVRKIDEVYGLILMADGAEIPLDSVSEISGDIFDSDD